MAGSEEANRGHTEPEDGYERMAELAERLATDIALTVPNWCALADDAAELAGALRIRCQRSRRTVD